MAYTRQSSQRITHGEDMKISVAHLAERLIETGVPTKRTLSASSNFQTIRLPG
ncbi:hypothetical protein [Candidatus Manganitrophus noduliformans]|uniref:hypothetical protein n=1 Tax=Candidatus Manganitrophus noduliformans TaxID=2606439 RepID=UPI00143A0A48|nr:hypothetical protein [Candidatus Manganitrophus noduliformans]